MTAYANVDGELLVEATLHVPNIGPWWADVLFLEAPDVEGSVVLTIGELTLRGTVTRTGTFGLQRNARIVAGAGGWGTMVEETHYHSDSGVSARTVAEDAARLAGETLGGFNPAAVTVGIDYARQTGPASRVLEDVIGSVPWYVDYDGQTQVGTRSSSEVNPDLYEVLDVDPQEGLVTLGVDDLSQVLVGSVISEGLDASVTLHELRVEVKPENVRVLGFFGGSLASRGRLAGLVRSIIERATEGRLFGLHEFRVVRMSSDRVELQSTEPGVSGLADAKPISMKPGAPGYHADLTPGTLVLVQFVNGLRTRPVITHFEGKDGTGWTPANVTIDADTLIKLGDSATKGVARLDDSVEVDVPISAFTDSNGDTSPTALVKLTGKITGASSKVQAE